jgi:bifunctional non-homologous end joining protein LigD
VFTAYTPMAPTQVREPFHRDGWVYEEKVDGWRMLADKDGARVRLVSRNGRDHMRRFAGIAAAVAKLSALSLVLDGEVAIFDEQLRSRFDWLCEPDPDAVATPPMFIAFDLLHRDGRELTGRPLRERRTRLEDVVADNELVLPVRRLATNGFEAWAE